MPSVDYFIEAYHPGVYSGNENEVVISGWFCSDVKQVSVTLEVDGERPCRFPIPDHRLPSPDIAERFGPRGVDARFHAVIRTPPDLTDFRRSRLVFELERGRAGVEVGSSFVDIRARDEEIADLLCRFESLGNNCEFGFMQRKAGVDQLGLFRFSGSFEGGEMARAIRANFAGFAEEDDLEAGEHYGEWVVKSRSYGFTLHTGRFPHTISREDITRKEGVKLRYLVRKFYEDLAEAEKFFVRRVREGEPVEGMVELHHAMRAHGPTRLLWVNLADEANPHGTIHEVEDGLFHGFIDHLAPFEDAFDTRADLWVDLLRRLPGMA